MKKSKGTGWINRAGRFLVLLLISNWACANELSFAPVVPIEAPRFTTEGARFRVYPSVAATATNALFMWEERGNYLNTNDLSATNVFALRIDADGMPSPRPPQFVAQKFRASGPVRLFPSEDGYLAVFSRALTAAAYPTPDWIFARLDANGAPVTPLTTIITNTPRAAVSSNGKTVLLVRPNQAGETNAFRYFLMNRDGRQLATGGIGQFNVPNNYYVLGTDGTDYLLAWRSSGPIRTTVINGLTGANSTTTLENDGFDAIGLGYGHNGYLLFSQQAGSPTMTKISQLSSNAKPLAQTTVTNTTRSWIAFDSPEGWTVFHYNYYGLDQPLQSLTVRTNGNSLLVEPGLYPIVSSYFELDPQLTIAPAGSNRFMLAGSKPVTGETGAGYFILTPEGASELRKPRDFANQASTHVAAGLDDYLVIWTEGTQLLTIRGLRLGKDGKALDSESFVIAEDPVVNFVGAPACTFDGTDFVVSWYRYDPPSASGQTVLVKVAPHDAPNPRKVVTSAQGSVLAFKGGLYVWRWSDSSVHLWNILLDGTPGPETVVNGTVLVTDGQNLYSFLSEGGTIIGHRVEPGVGMVGDALSFGSGFALQGVSIPHAFVITWTDSGGLLNFTIMDDHGVRRHGVIPLRVPIGFNASVMANEKMVLAAVRTNYNSGSFNFGAVDLATGGTATGFTDLHAGSIDLATLGTDFLAAMDVTRGFSAATYSGLSWISGDSAPIFGMINFAGGERRAILNSLHPLRRYRVEASEDLVNWNFQRDVTNSDSIEITLDPNHSQYFVRALLKPE